MKITNPLPGLVLLFAAAFSAAAQTITPTPTNGPTFKGRVLDDATGKPIADVPIHYAFVFDRDGDHSVPGVRGSDTRTDAEGRYEGRYEPPGGAGNGHYSIETRANNYVWQAFNVDKADIGKMASIPDTRLQHGGWISGRAEHPAEAVPDDRAFVKLESQGPLPDHSQLPLVEADRDGKFRTPLLPSGTYTLRGQWLARITNGGRVSYRPLVSSISNINVIAGQDTTNVIIPTNNVVYTNRASGR